MATRCLTVIKESGKTDKDKDIVVIYRQADGYPICHGADIIRAFENTYLVDGLGGKDEHQQVNGMHEAAARLVCALKSEYLSGNIYLYPAGTRDMGDDYIYIVYPLVEPTATVNKGELGLRVESYGELLYDGPLNEYVPANN